MDRNTTGTPCAIPARGSTQQRWWLAGIGLMSILLLPLASCATTLTLTGAQNKKKVQAHVGDEIRLALDANLTTGYRWSVEKTDEALISLQESDFTASSPRMGSDGTQTLTWLARSAGTVELQLKYWRSFEGNGSITRRFAVTIQIEA